MEGPYTYADFAKDLCRYEWNDLDEIDQTNVIAFTWTPNPGCYPSSECRAQYKVLLQHILLCSYKFFTKYMFIPEINLNGNVHIHGWFIIKDKISFYKQFIPRCKQLGYVLLKNKNINIEWEKYCEKDLTPTIEILGFDLPIPLTQHNNKMYIEEKHRQLKAKRVPRYNMSKYF